MFISAAVNAIVALNFSMANWASIMLAYGIVSKAALFLIGYGTMRYIGGRRWQAMPIPERDSLTAALPQ